MHATPALSRQHRKRTVTDEKRRTTAMSTETTEPARTPLNEKALRGLIAQWREREEAAKGHGDREVSGYADALGVCANELERLTAAAFGGEHKCAFPCNPPGGSFWAPGPCLICGKTYERSQAERQMAEAQAAMEATS
jgi:hypothetical protein